MTSLRIAILSDTHGDLVAFERAIADLEKQSIVDEVLMGGDLAQGGAQPAETVDRIRQLGWPSVRGNSDDLLVLIGSGASAEEAFAPSRPTHGKAPPEAVERAIWSTQQLTSERIDYLRSLPLAIVRSSGPATMRLVHATPWSTEDVVLPDAEEELARRMAREGECALVAYGHIHTQYFRKTEDGVLMSVGAIMGSNDADTRPAYTIVTLGDTIDVEFRRVDWPAEERAAAYAMAGVDSKFNHDTPGPFPVRVKHGASIRIWP